MSSALDNGPAATSYDAVLLLAFGGPDSPEEIRPFVARVLNDRTVPAERVEEVVRHYQAVGGRSPLVEITLSQARALEKELKSQGCSLPVYVGLRHSRPFVRDVLERMAADRVTRALGFILSAHRTQASWERYQESAAAARAELGERCPHLDYCPGWHSQPLLIQAWVELIGVELGGVPPERRASIPLIFTAHSVPAAMAERSPYVEQIHETASLIAARLAHGRWSVAYQSRSGNPRDRWLEPDILSVIRDLRADGIRELVVAPIGFVCDHVEVLYDLDIDARKVAEDLGLRFYRARCVNDHPTFIRMMAEVIQQKIRGPKMEDRG